MLNVIQKYRHFLLPLVLVVILDLTLLGMNFAISAQLEAASTEINLAGRQRMLTQRISKAVMQLHYQREKWWGRAGNIRRAQRCQPTI